MAIYTRAEMEAVVAGHIVAVSGISASLVRRVNAALIQPNAAFISIMCEVFDTELTATPYIDDDIKYFRMSADFQLECIGEVASDYLAKFKRRMFDANVQEIQEGLSMGMYFPIEEIAYDVVTFEDTSTVRIGRTVLRVRYIQSEANTDTTGFAATWIASMLIEGTEGNPPTYTLTESLPTGD